MSPGDHVFDFMDHFMLSRVLKQTIIIVVVEKHNSVQRTWVRRAFGTVLRMLLGCPDPISEFPGFGADSTSDSFLPNTHHRRQQMMMTQRLGSCHPRDRSDWVLTTGFQPGSAAVLGILEGSQLTQDQSLSLSLLFCAFQINQNK